MFEVFFLHETRQTEDPIASQPCASSPQPEGTPCTYEGESYQSAPSQEAPTPSPHEVWRLLSSCSSSTSTPLSGVESRLLCQYCTKTFSTLSARNQHAKTGCKKLKRARFLCRTDGCEKSFSTDANRRDHELKRCPFRMVV